MQQSNKHQKDTKDQPHAYMQSTVKPLPDGVAASNSTENVSTYRHGTTLSLNKLKEKLKEYEDTENLELMSLIIRFRNKSVSYLTVSAMSILLLALFQPSYPMCRLGNCFKYPYSGKVFLLPRASLFFCVLAVANEIKHIFELRSLLKRGCLHLIKRGYSRDYISRFAPNSAKYLSLCGQSLSPGMSGFLLSLIILGYVVPVALYSIRFNTCKNNQCENGSFADKYSIDNKCKNGGFVDGFISGLSYVFLIVAAISQLYFLMNKFFHLRKEGVEKKYLSLIASDNRFTSSSSNPVFINGLNDDFVYDSRCPMRKLSTVNGINFQDSILKSGNVAQGPDGVLYLRRNLVLWCFYCFDTYGKVVSPWDNNITWKIDLRRMQEDFKLFNLNGECPYTLSKINCLAAPMLDCYGYIFEKNKVEEHLARSDAGTQPTPLTNDPKMRIAMKDLLPLNKKQLKHIINNDLSTQTDEENNQTHNNVQLL